MKSKVKVSLRCFKQTSVRRWIINRKLEGWRSAEIATALQIDEGTVYTDITVDRTIPATSL